MFSFSRDISFFPLDLKVLSTNSVLNSAPPGVPGSPSSRTTASGCRLTWSRWLWCLGSSLRAAAMLTSGSPSTASSTARTKTSTGSTTKTRLETTGSVELGQQQNSVEHGTLNVKEEVTWQTPLFPSRWNMENGLHWSSSWWINLIPLS